MPIPNWPPNKGEQLTNDAHPKKKCYIQDFPNGAHATSVKVSYTMRNAPRAEWKSAKTSKLRKFWSRASPYR